MEGEQTSNGDQGWRPRVLVLDDEWSTLEHLKTALKDDYEVSAASRPQEALALIERGAFDVVLTDLRMPDMDGLSLVKRLKQRFPETQYILMTAFHDMDAAVNAIRLGVADYLRKPFTKGEVRFALSRCLEERRLRREVARLQWGPGLGLMDIIAQSQSMRQVIDMARTVAATDATVLIAGETGVGKGVLARALHNASSRRDHPFVEINCATIPAPLIESELFGHERGSFTGAHARKIGRVETAHQGTLFLDEIGEMPLDMQAKLLTFLQEFSFERVGGTQRLKAEVRLVAASNRDLRQAVEEGNFRRDLFYRLHVIHLDLPALRARREDIPLLAQHFLRRFGQKYGKQLAGFSPAAQNQMLTHTWPGNVREMENAIERAVILSRGGRVERLDLSDSPTSRRPPAEAPTAAAAFTGPAPPEDLDPTGLPLSAYLAACEERYLRTLLSNHQGSLQQTARAAQVNAKTLYLKMTRHGLDKHAFRTHRGARGRQEQE
jgi:DNA-binding NtrC family response regulator